MRRLKYANRPLQKNGSLEREIVTIDEFWKLLETIDSTALDSGEGDADDALAPLIDAISKLKVTEIESFEEHLARVLFTLDGKAYADNCGKSDDGFLYARCFVVGMGKQFYERVVANPSDMPKSSDQWLEPLLSVASQGWAKVTGNYEEDWDHKSTVSYQTGSNSDQW